MPTAPFFASLLTRTSASLFPLLLLTTGCAAPEHQPLRIPVASAHYQGDTSAPNRDKPLLVFLPGRGTVGKDFVRQGFIKTVEMAAVDHATMPVDRATKGGEQRTDFITVDLTLPYYEQRIASERLHDDIIAPARRAGYRRIWLVGVSMGGLGAIFYDHDYPGEISGIVALAPFLGEKNIVAEIATAGSLDRWQPRQPLANDDFQRRLWLAIRAGRYGQPGHLPLVLGFGSHDRFAYGHRLLAANLPSDRVFKTFGFHDWATWHHLWKEILASPVSPVAR